MTKGVFKKEAFISTYDVNLRHFSALQTENVETLLYNYSHKKQKALTI